MGDILQRRLETKRFTPLSDNPFKTRDDVVDAFWKLFNPLLPAFSPGRAGVFIDCSGAKFDRRAIGLEGFARPLWGIIPLALGGVHFDHWDLYVEGLSNGTDPNHEEYWGTISGIDQLQVELAAVGLALAVLPDKIWDPLSAAAKKNVVAYLQNARNNEYPACNWIFFRALVDLGLERVGATPAADQSPSLDEYLNEIDSYYMADGWYRDGIQGEDRFGIDYYNPFALHFYGLVYVKVRPQDKERCARYRERSRLYAPQLLNWFAQDGASVPYGRSLTYRFACGAFWGALAYADESPLPWGVLKGLYMRHWRWWADKPITDLDTGRLTIGYTYPNQFMSESYNSACSPYWAMKMFFALAVPATHPFWTAEELPIERAFGVPKALPTPGMVAVHHPDHSTIFVSGPRRQNMRWVTEKYGKFAYSTRYGFSIESDWRHFTNGVFDSMIAFSDDNMHFRVRDKCTKVRAVGDMLYSTWNPWPDVNIETWIIPRSDYHLRIHKIKSARKLHSIEGGFSVSYDNEALSEPAAGSSEAYIETPFDFAGIKDLSGSRTARCHTAEGNVNILYPRTALAQLLGDIPANTETVFSCAVIASSDKAWATKAWKTTPTLPSLSALESKLASSIKVGYSEND